MKILIFFPMMFLSISSSFSQNAPINFEVGGFGADWTWTVFENSTNPPLEIIDNPDPSDINPSSKVARFTALQSGNPFAGCESFEGNLGSFMWDENNRTLKIMVWKSVISNVGIKFDTGAPPNDWAEPEIKVPNTKINQWEELTFDFSGALNPPPQFGGLKRIIIFPDFDLGGRTQDNVIYFDNITFNSVGVGGTEPTVAAPTPTKDAANVISLFSDAYDNVLVDTWRTPWSSANLEDIEIQGNATKKYSNLDFVGIETVVNQIDVTEMTHFSIDIWSANFNFFGVKLVDFGPDGAFGGGDDTEHQVDFDMPALGQWLTLDIPLSAFVNLQNRRNIAQLILVGRPVAANKVYVDNVFFYKPGGVNTRNINMENAAIQVYPNPVNVGEELYFDTPLKSITVMDINGRIIFQQESQLLNTLGMNPGIYILHLTTEDNKVAHKRIVVR